MRDTLFVGDVQGCATELRNLLDVAGFDPGGHRLALCGDLINRGPDSAGVLDLARRLDALTVLGNHEVALLEGKRTATLDLVRQQLGSALEEWRGGVNTPPPSVRAGGHHPRPPGPPPRDRPPQSHPPSAPPTPPH